MLHRGDALAQQDRARKSEHGKTALVKQGWTRVAAKARRNDALP